MTLVGGQARNEGRYAMKYATPRHLAHTLADESLGAIELSQPK
jgi:hypothetical protein